MKILYLITLLFINSLVFSQSQLQMNDEEHGKFLKADKELNNIYKQIINDYKSDTAFIRNFKKSQRLWIQFRDSELMAMYPEREVGYYGSIHPACLSIFNTEFTNDRINYLSRWLIGEKEGNSCAPSIKVKQQ